MSNKLLLFADTNLFMQCRPLPELDWNRWTGFEEIEVYVTRPVQTEIDELKYRGNDRLAKRARTASALLRELVFATDQQLAIRNEQPRVTLRLDSTTKPNPDLRDSLDYTRRDDQLVGTMHQYVKEHTGAVARLLTHDTGPMSSAIAVNLVPEPIPDSWLVPPETSPAEKRAAALEKENALLKSQEPSFVIQGQNSRGMPVDTFDLDVVLYRDLTQLELDELLAEVRQLHPMRQDAFPKLGPADLLLGATVEPPSDEALLVYRDEQYPRWLTNCEEVLRTLPQALESGARPLLNVAVTNIGARPGKDCLVTLAARGPFKIGPPSDDRVVPALPRAPEPPSPRVRRVVDAFNSVTELLNPRSNYSPTDLRLPAIPHRRDPNAFYYKPRKPVLPISEFTLECEQWRHGVETELFQAELFVEERGKAFTGAIQCHISAENLSYVVEKVVPLRIRFTEQSPLPQARDLIERLGAS